MFKKKLYLYFFISFTLCFNLNAEYILVQTNSEQKKTSVVEMNHKLIDQKIWDILNTLQFPQNLNKYFLSLYHEPSISSRLSLRDQEYLYLKELIKKYFPNNANFDLIYIPNSIFEIFSIDSDHTPLVFRKETIEGKSYNTYSIDYEQIFDSDSLLQKTLKDRNTDYFTFIIYDFVRNTFAKKRSIINNKIYSLLFGKSYTRKSPGYPISILEILPNLTRISKDIFISKNHFWKMFDQEIQAFKNDSRSEKLFAREIAPKLIDRVVKIEQEIYYKNFYPLYRGESSLNTISNHIPKIELKEIDPPFSLYLDEDEIGNDENVKYYMEKNIKKAIESLSYGASLFAGVYYDQGACSASYMLGRKNTFSHILPIDKKYLSTENSIYYLPTLPLLLSHYAKGELFHIRNKIPMKYMKNYLIQNHPELDKSVKGPTNYLTLSLISGIYVSDYYPLYDALESIINTPFTPSELSQIHNHHLKNAKFVRK
jgi:hypothetical protein